jgi:hypothetical protein
MERDRIEQLDSTADAATQQYFEAHTDRVRAEFAFRDTFDPPTVKSMLAVVQAAEPLAYCTNVWANTAGPGGGVGGQAITACRSCDGCRLRRSLDALREQVAS